MPQMHATFEGKQPQNDRNATYPRYYETTPAPASSMRQSENVSPYLLTKRTIYNPTCLLFVSLTLSLIFLSNHDMDPGLDLRGILARYGRPCFTALYKLNLSSFIPLAAVTAFSFSIVSRASTSLDIIPLPTIP